MSRCSMGLALAGWCLAGSLALAQFGLPDAGCNGAPGPMNRCLAPPGPGDELGLPPDLPNAFSPPPECCVECFFSAGSIALMRQRMGQSALAVANGVTALEFDDVRSNFNLGARGSAGLIWGNQAIEISGYYIPPHDSSITSTTPGQQTFFTNAAILPTPALLRPTLTTSIGNYEANFRTWSAAWTGPELILGCRFMDQSERLNILGSDGVNQEIYSTRVLNRIVGPTLGGEYGIPVGSSASFTLAGKATWGWNLVHGDTRLENNGALIADFNNDRTIFSHIYEIAMYADLWLADPIHVRIGCQALWILHLAEAVKQINFDATAAGFENNQGSIMYWGPTAEVQFVW